jgi:hypothetical protein
MVDEFNRPLYGDPFGVLGEDGQVNGYIEGVYVIAFAYGLGS